jgi:hypothetical protein
MSDEIKIKTFSEFETVWSASINDLKQNLRKIPIDETEIFNNIHKLLLLIKLYPKYFDKFSEDIFDYRMKIRVKSTIFQVITVVITNKNYSTKLINLYNEVFDEDYYSNTEQTKYIRNQVDEYFIPDLGNIIDSYVGTNDRCEMLSENGDRCGYKSEYIKTVDGVNYRENCKQYCKLHCLQSFQKYIDTEPKKVVIDENDVKTQFTVDKWFIFYEHFLHKLYQEQYAHYNSICVSLKNEKSLDIEIFCRVPKNIVINNVSDCKIYFLDSDNNQVRWISTYQWKIKEMSYIYGEHDLERSWYKEMEEKQKRWWRRKTKPRKQEYIVILKYTLSYL